MKTLYALGSMEDFTQVFSVIATNSDCKRELHIWTFQE